MLQRVPMFSPISIRRWRSINSPFRERFARFPCVRVSRMAAMPAAFFKFCAWRWKIFHDARPSAALVERLSLESIEAWSAHRRIISATAFSVASVSPFRHVRPRRNGPGYRGCRQRVEDFLHPTRVSCVFIRGVGSPWNENGAPAWRRVRRELVSPAHFSRGRTPENRLSPRGPATERRTQCCTFAVLASHPFQSSQGDVKMVPPGGRRQSSWSRK